jgi:CRP-like cAMP-binding protein
MKRNQNLEQLRGLPPFHGCSDTELRRIDGLTCLQEVPAGTVLCRQGSIGREAFIVVSGEAAVTIDRVRVAYLGRGAFVGEMAVLDGASRTATVMALSDMKVLVLSSCELEVVLADIPRVARRMLATMSTRLRIANATPVGPADEVGGASAELRPFAAACGYNR